MKYALYFTLGLWLVLAAACGTWRDPETPRERANCCKSLEANVSLMRKHARDDMAEQGAIDAYRQEYSERCGCDTSAQY
jgi:hypothetical protein